MNSQNIMLEFDSCPKSRSEEWNSAMSENILNVCFNVSDASDKLFCEIFIEYLLIFSSNFKDQYRTRKFLKAAL